MGDTVTPFRLGCVGVLVNLALNLALVLDEVPLHWTVGGVTLIDVTLPAAGLGGHGRGVGHRRFAHTWRRSWAS